MTKLTLDVPPFRRSRSSGLYLVFRRGSLQNDDRVTTRLRGCCVSGRLETTLRRSESALIVLPNNV